MRLMEAYCPLVPETRCGKRTGGRTSRWERYDRRNITSELSDVFICRDEGTGCRAASRPAQTAEDAAAGAGLRAL